MATNYNPKLVTNGLVFCADIANPKSYNPNLVTTLGAYNYSFDNQSIPTALDTDPTGQLVLCKHDLTGASSPFMNVRVDRTLITGTYTISAWVKGTTSFTGAFSYIGETPGSSGATSTTISVTTAWQRVTHTFTITTQQTAGRVQIFFSTQGENKVISVYGVELVKGSSTTPQYIDSNNRGDTWYDLVGTDHLTVYGLPDYVVNGSLLFGTNQTTQYVADSSFALPAEDHTIEYWFYTTFPSSQSQTPFTYQIESDTNYLLNILDGPTTVTFYRGSLYQITSVSNMSSRWNMMTRTRVKATGVEKYYLNAVEIGTRTVNTGSNTVTPGYLILAQEADSLGGGFDPNQNLDGNISRLSVYNAALTAMQVQQNYNTIKTRYGL
jgi:hypothetical protein